MTDQAHLDEVLKNLASMRIEQEQTKLIHTSGGAVPYHSLILSAASTSSQPFVSLKIDAFSYLFQY